MAETTGLHMCRAEFALDQKPAAMHLHQRFDEAESEAESEAGAAGLAVEVVALLEGHKHPFGLIGRHAATGIGDRYWDTAIGHALTGDGHAPSCRRVFHGVGQQIQQHLKQNALVRTRFQGAGRQFDPQLDLPVARQLRDNGGRALGSRSNLQILNEEIGLTGLDPGKVEDVVDQGEKMARCIVDMPGIFGLDAVFEDYGMQQFRKADDRVQRRADLVAHVGEKAGYGAARLFRAFAFDLGALVLGQCTRLGGFALFDLAHELGLARLQPAWVARSLIFARVKKWMNHGATTAGASTGRIIGKGWPQ
jgi:hypothetical protein